MPFRLRDGRQLIFTPFLRVYRYRYQTHLHKPTYTSLSSEITTKRKNCRTRKPFIYTSSPPRFPRLLSVGLAVRVPVVHVLAVRTRMGEPLQALAALERLLAAVQTLVLGQMVLVLEGFRTLVALVRPLT